MNQSYCDFCGVKINKNMDHSTTPKYHVTMDGSLSTDYQRYYDSCLSCCQFFEAMIPYLFENMKIQAKERLAKL